MIRVLVAPQSGAASPQLESAIRSIPSLVFAGAVDPYHAPPELAGDVLIVEAPENDEYDSQAFADLPIPVVLLANTADSALVTSALRAGVRGVISFDATAQEIESAVMAAHAGLVVIAPAALERVLPENHLFSEELSGPLSARELEVLDLLAEGLSNKLVAHRLNISEHTVKTHVASIFAKLGASSRTEAVSQAIRRGLVLL